MKKVIFLNLFVLIALITNGQKGKVEKSIVGVFTGGNCYENNKYCGFWYLKADSSFIFITGKNQFANVAGTGKWKLSTKEDSTFIFTFDTSVYLLQPKAKISYEASTKFSHDSLYFHVNIVDETGKPGSFTSIKTGSKVGYADKNGRADFAVFNEKKNNKLTFSCVGCNYADITIPVLPTGNYHSLSVTMSSVDSTTLSVISSGESVKISFTYKSNRRNDLYLTYRPEKKNELVSYIKNGINNQTMYKTYLGYLLDKIKSE
jgi:hypothetical protein